MKLSPWRAVAAAVAITLAGAGVALAVNAIRDTAPLPGPAGSGSTTVSDPSSDPDRTGDPDSRDGDAPSDGPAPSGGADAGSHSTAPVRPPLADPPDPGPVPDDHGLTDADLAAAVASSVRVAAPACRGIVREGSGFAVGDGDLGDGDLVVTIAHLVVGMEEPEVELADGRKLAAVTVAFDPVNDLAVLRVPGAGLRPLPLSEAAPDGTQGAVLAWEAEATPDPTPFRIDRPVTVRTEPVGDGDRIERPSWLLAADTEVGDSGAALVADLDGQITAVGVAWGASRRGGGGVAYATRASAVERLFASSNLNERAELPDCG